VTETALDAGRFSSSSPVRSGETVRRRAGAWTPAVHALLRHLEHKGFDRAPRPIGIDDQGREVLTFVPGDPAVPPLPLSDDVLAALAELLRRYHECVRDFVPPADACWRLLPGADTHGELICHYDLYPGNVVLRDGLPAAFLDWDFAAPGSPADDLASLAGAWVPLLPDEAAARWGLPVDRRGERLRLLCDAYGLEAAKRADVLAARARRLALARDAIRMWGGAEQQPGWRERWEAGHAEAFDEELRWLEIHRRELEEAVR
jgi:hypothetical protein